MTYLAGFCVGAPYGFLAGFLVSLAWYTHKYTHTPDTAAEEPREDTKPDPLCPWHEEWRRHVHDN